MSEVTFDDITHAFVTRLIDRGYKPVPVTSAGAPLLVVGPYSPTPVRVSEALAIEIDVWFRQEVVRRAKGG